MDERDAFLKAIEANRLDPNTRRVFADWLDEHGETGQAADQRILADMVEQSVAYLNDYAKKGEATLDELLEDPLYYYQIYGKEKDLEDLGRHFKVVTGEGLPTEELWQDSCDWRECG